MNVDNGKIIKMHEGEAMRKGYIPIPAKKVTPMSKWGKKKRERYEELCNEGLRPEVAFMCVEDFKGDKSKIHGEFL